MKRILSLILSITLMLSLIACGGSAISSWSRVVLGNELPTPASTKIEIQSNTAEKLYGYIKNISPAQYVNYVNECKSAGFMVYPEETGESFKAYNNEGYYLDIFYSEYSKEITIDFEAPKVMSALEWSTRDNAKQLPLPKSSVAYVRNENNFSYELFVGESTLEDFQDYVNDCQDKGFVIDVQETDHTYHALNEEEYELTLEHQGGNVLYIKVIEKRVDVQIKLLHANKNSADMYNLKIEIDDMWEEDSEKGDDVVMIETSLKKGEHILVIENDDDDDINGRVDFKVSNIGECFEFEIDCLSNEIVIRQFTDMLSDTTDTTNNETVEETKTPTEDKEENNNIISVTEQAYNDAGSLTVNDLVKKEDQLGVSYSYQGLELLSEDCEWIENLKNTDGTVESGAIYRKIAKALEGFDIGNNWKGYAKWLIGFIPERREAFAPYVENAITFITTTQPLKNSMEKFESLECVSGTFDYNNSVFEFEIDSLSECVSEMQISEEMLGYILAMFDEYGVITTFDGDSCIVSYKDYRN